MDYLARESSSFDSNFWSKIDKVVNDVASKILIARRFLSIYGPLGAGTTSIQCDKFEKEENFDNGIVRTVGRTFYELPQVYEDFSIFWRDIENNLRSGMPLDLSSVAGAAQNLAKKEDTLIFYGNSSLKSEGLMNAQGVQKLKIGDWSKDENSFTDIVKAINMMQAKDIVGSNYALVLSKDLYLDLQRIQQGTGMTEYQRISKMLGGIYNTSILKEGQGVLLCPEFQYMDLAIGQDMVAAYLEQKDLNHSFRLLETVFPRIKNSNAIVVFE